MRRDWVSWKLFMYALLILVSGTLNLHCVNGDNDQSKNIQGSSTLPQELPAFQMGTLTPSLKDTQEINQLIKQCWDNYVLRPDSIYRIALDLLRSSEHIQYDLGIAKSFNLMGACYQSKQVYDTAIGYYQQAFNYYEKANAEVCSPANMRNVMGVCYGQLGKPDSAIYYYLQSIDLIQKSKHIDCKASQKVLVHSYANLANLSADSYGPLTDKPQALVYYHKAIDMAHKLHDTAMMAKIHLCIANCFAPINFDSSLNHFRQGLRIAGMVKDTATLGEAYRILGNTYANRKDWVSAKQYYDSAMTCYAAGNNNSPYYGDLLLGLGSYYVTTRAFPEAVQYFEKAESIYQQQKAMNNSVLLYNNWATLYEKMGNWKTAYEKKLLQDSLNRLVINDEIIKTSQLMEARFRSMEKDKSLILLQNRVQKQYLSIGGLLAIVIIIFLAAIILFRQRKHGNEIAQLKAQRDGEEQERLRLAQELHDGIVSELSAIKMSLQRIPSQYADINNGKEDYKQIVYSLEHSISELRDTTHNLLPTILQQKGLLAAIQSFCSRLSQPGILEVTFIAMDTLPPLADEFQLNIYRIIQEILNNITKHALMATQVIVQINQAPNTSLLLLSIEDNGLQVSYTEESGAAKNGIGLYNLHKRIALLHGKMEQERNSRGNSVYLEFDITSYKNSPHVHKNSHYR